MTNLDELLRERHKTHGSYTDHARVTQRLKRTIREELMYCGKSFDDLPPDMQETLDMTCHKVGRIVAGNADEADHWRDIAGYNQLVANRLIGNAAVEQAIAPAVTPAEDEMMRKAARRFAPVMQHGKQQDENNG